MNSFESDFLKAFLIIKLSYGTLYFFLLWLNNICMLAKDVYVNEKIVFSVAFLCFSDLTPQYGC